MLLLSKGVKLASVDVVKHERPASDDFLPIEGSVTSQKDCNDALQAVIGRWGRLDILVNNAGVMDNMGKHPQLARPPSTHDILCPSPF
jgi:NADP-dependent 3-hydroxy acid dehydrogenase YdfG